MTDFVMCPECSGTKSVWGDYNGSEIEAECPYCGGSGQVRRGAVERDYRCPDCCVVSLDPNHEDKCPRFGARA